MKTSTCQHCFNDFIVSPGSYGKFCSLSCGTKQRYIIEREQKIASYDVNPNTCANCKTILVYKQRGNKFCSRKCAAAVTTFSPRKRGPTKKETYPYTNVRFIQCEYTGNWYANKNSDGSTRRCSPYIKSEKEAYYNAARFRFNVYHYPNEFDMSLLDTVGWYTCPGKKRKNSPKNTSGISRDHLISVSYGFKNKIDPLIIGHPANCRLIPHSENKKKADSCFITLAELLDRITEWNRKYSSPSG